MKKGVGIDVKQISVFGLTTCLLTISGETYCVGNNDDGQFGDGTTTGSTIFKKVLDNYQFDSFCREDYSDSQHICGFLENGTALCLGNNNNGKLGDDTTTQRTTPVSVYGNYNFSKIYSRRLYSCGLLQNGTALCWGFNLQGTLGDNSTISKNIPTLVYGNYTFTSIKLGNGHTCGLLQNGTALCWGWNTYGQLGDGSLVNKLLPTSVRINEIFSSFELGGIFTFGILTDGRIISFGDNSYGQQAFFNFNSKIPTKNIYKGKLFGKGVDSFEFDLTMDNNLNILVNNGFQGFDFGDNYSNFVLSYKNREAKVYLNGELSETFNPPGFSLSTQLEDLIIGNFVYGKIDDLLMWNRSLSDAEIEFIYKSNLEKLNETSWSFTTSFIGLVETIYTYGVYVQDDFGWISSLRNLIVNFPDVSIPSSSGGGLSITYDLNKLEKGISGHYPKNYVISFDRDFVKVNNISEDKVELNVSGMIVEIVFENTTKIDSDDDGFYDLEISLGGKNSIYAELSIKSIYEKIPAISEEAKVVAGEEIVEEKVGFFGRIWNWFVGLFIKS